MAAAGIAGVHGSQERAGGAAFWGRRQCRAEGRISEFQFRACRPAPTGDDRETAKLKNCDAEGPKGRASFDR